MIGCIINRMAISHRPALNSHVLSGPSLYYEEKCSIHGFNSCVADLVQLNYLIFDGEIIWEMGSRKVLRLHDPLEVKTGDGYLYGVDDS